MIEFSAFLQIEEAIKSFGFTINSYHFKRPWGGLQKCITKEIKLSQTRGKASINRLRRLLFGS
mgnify:CR=1 FL=1